jgi:hypothetical protein
MTHLLLYTVVYLGRKCLPRVACVWSKMPMFHRAGTREGGEPLPLAFQLRRPVETNWADPFKKSAWVDPLISIFDSYGMKTFWLKCLFFSHFVESNWRPLISKSWHSVASEDIMTKFKSQGLHIIRIKYWNACGSGKHFRPECMIPYFYDQKKFFLTL